jgi:phosphatidylinositol alpha-mannosyltransferase
MKIVQLCPYAMDRPGGVQRHVRDLSTWLTAQGHETRIVAPPEPGRQAARTGALTELGRSRSLSVHGTAFELAYAGPGAVRRVARDLRDWGADVVHMHTPWTPLLVWQVWRALRLPTVTTIHATLPSIDSPALVDRYIRWAARYFLTRTQATILPSEAPLPLIARLAPGTRALVLPPAVDLSDWRALDTPRPGRTGLSLFFLGRLEARKGVADLLAAWDRIATTLPQATLTIAGDGALRDMVATSTTPRLSLVGRPDDAAARSLMARADIFLAPAAYGESFGIVLTEAMSAGAVPIAAANAGYASVMTGDGASLLVPPGDSAALADRILSLAADFAERTRLRDWGRAHAAQFDIANVGPEYLETYDRVAAWS